MHTLRTHPVNLAAWTPPWADITQATGPVEVVAAVPWETLGLSGMAVLAVYLVLTGRITHRSQTEDARADRDQWRDAHSRSEESRRLLLDELRRMTTALERLAGQKDLGVALLRSIRKGTADQEDEQEEDR